MSLRSLSCKSLLIVAFIVAKCDAECGCYALFNFEIKPVIEWYRVYVLQLSLLTVFTGSVLDFFFILTKNINYRAKVRKF